MITEKIQYLRALEARYPGSPIPVEFMTAGELADILEELRDYREREWQRSLEAEQELGTHFGIVGGDVLELDGPRYQDMDDEIPF